MPAYWVARAKINDPAEYKKYADQVPAILANYGGKVLARGGRFQIMVKELLPELGCETDCTAGFAFVCRSMIEPKAGPTAGSGVTRWCSAESFDALYGITRARSASRERDSLPSPGGGGRASKRRGVG